MSIKPLTKVPNLRLPVVSGGSFHLLESHPRAFTMIVAYRGLHCPICKSYLRDLDRKPEDFTRRGVNAVAISTDGKERAERAKHEWGIEHLPIAYGLSIEQAREWGCSFPRPSRTASPSCSRSPDFSS